MPMLSHKHLRWGSAMCSICIRRGYPMVLLWAPCSTPPSLPQAKSSASSSGSAISPIRSVTYLRGVTPYVTATALRR